MLPKPLQNSLKTTFADTAIFPSHQQPPFTSKNSHHVVPLISTRCTQNNSQTIPKTAPFFLKNSTSFIYKTTPLYLQNSTKTTMKTPQKRCKRRPVDGDSGRRRATSADGVHRRRLPPVTATCIMPLVAAAFMSPQHVPSNPNEFLVSGGALCTPPVGACTPVFCNSQNAPVGFLISRSTSCTPID